MICTNDDLANCCGHCEPKIIAVIPVLGRRELVKHTIERLLKKNGVSNVICVGDNFLDKYTCVKAGAEWVQYRNKPLGDKWNHGFFAAEKYKPDACLFVGSSDWLSDNWLPVMVPYLKNHDLIGTPGCHFLHIGKDFKLCYWPGYNGPRAGESIGIGRLISSKVLDRLQWKPFFSHMDNSLDGSMQQRCRGVAAKIQVVDSSKIKSVSISTDVWVNKHRFTDHFNNILPSTKIENANQWVEDNFPEAKTVCASLKGTSVSQ